MVSKGSGRAYIRVRPNDPSSRFNKVIRNFQREYTSIIKAVEKRGLQIIKSNTPKKTGRTANAWRSQSTVANGRGSIELNNPLPQSVYLDKGTKSSPGRYVPTLGRRITTGTHPGIQGTQYIGRSTDEIRRLMLERLDRLITMIKLDTAKQLKG